MRGRRYALAVGLAAAAGTAFAISAREPGRPAGDAREAIATLSSSIAFLERRLERDPENFLAAGHLAERYMLRYQLGAKQSDVERAEAVTRELIAVAPARAAALARLSSIHLAQHEFADALETAEEAAREDSTSEPALAALFDAAMASGRYERAEWAGRRLPAGSAAGQIRTASWLSAHGESDGAYASLSRVCDHFRQASLRPQLVAWCLTELAALQQDREGVPAARDLLHDALRVQPGYRGAIEALADLAHAEGDWKGAARHYASIVADAHPDLYLRLAEVHRALGNTSPAREHERAFLLVAGRPEAEALHAHPLALFRVAQPGGRDVALAIALRDVERRPAVESFDVLSWVHFRRGELSEALAASDSAAHWGSPSPTMQYHRARILQALGRTYEAAILLRAVRQRPDLLEPEARLELGRPK